MTEIRDFMTKENLEMIGLAVMCDRFSHLYKSDRRYSYEKGCVVPSYEPITVVLDPAYHSTSYSLFFDLVHRGQYISTIMDFFEEELDGECKIKDVVKYLKEKRGCDWTIQGVTTACRKLCASGYLKQRYSDPYKITVKNTEYGWGPNRFKEVTREVEVRDSLYSLA